MSEFQLGQSSLDVCKTIVSHQPEISGIRLISHRAEINWRQRYQTTDERMRNMLEGFEHPGPIAERELTREGFTQLTIDELGDLEDGQVWSVISKVKCYDGKSRHIPMMNFHPKNGLEGIRKAIGIICRDNRGVLLDSGRFQHYYGDFLLEEGQWTRFMAEFLMPTILVSPRYVGHRLYQGFCTLRLTSDSTYKPKTPEVIEII